MNKKKKTVLTLASVFVVVFIIFAVIWVKFVPTQDFEFLRNSDSPISEILCIYPIKVSGDSMSPLVEGGTQINFNKCFDPENLSKNLVILYQDNSAMRLAVIRDIQQEGRLVYKVSNERDLYRLQDILPSEIVAISDIDTSMTEYNPENQPEIPELNFEDYLSEAYLGIIPKNTGIENATIQETDQFDLQENKFCFVVNPVKNLQKVDIVISKKDPEEISFEKKNISWSVGENINCDDQEIKLNEGNYKFEIFIDNLLIKSIDFTVIN